MSKHSSYQSYGSPRMPAEDSFNPYEKAKRQSVLEQQRREMFQRYNSPKIIIKDDPVVPSYPIVELNKKNAHYHLKIVVVGDGGCGKTCLLVSYAQNKFPEIYVPTIFENYVTIVQAPNNKLIELALWDTAGQEEYDRLRPLLYPDVDVLLVCFALDNLVSLQNIKDTWFPEVSHFCPGVPIVLVGTKADLPSQIDPDLPIQLATEINAVGYIQCSAKTMFNIKMVFNFALNQFQKQVEMQEQVEKSAGSRKRLSRVLHGSSLGGSYGSNNLHSRNVSSTSKRGHLKSDSAALLDSPLMEDNFTQNPYGNFQGESKYNEEEFAFTRNDRKKKKRRCVIL
ncbi:ras-domain-containing protein [Suhomyces tanzawaensis NRRL Y-17324]|uniref:Ras-domain-containing protein n=1 Tax=Suhomyces tanzawaensis NRRL Y-17324 TaxID=984487 RepID=A0A1E4SDK3_9ASCO|nr:ras-domain-containing protein [Suhomyces tanzawaensis NRRL Y-17324]ODV77601.1 ras-domain-containing protein [Suhomyces tanzawaensis NRRL Y-17324]